MTDDAEADNTKADNTEAVDEVTTPDAAAGVATRVAITGLVVGSMLGLVIVDVLTLFTGLALTDGSRKDPHLVPARQVLDLIPAIAIAAFLVVGLIGIIRLGRSRRTVLGQLRHERGLILMLVIGVANIVLFVCAWLVFPEGQLKYLTYVGLLGIVLGVMSLVLRGRAYRLPVVVVDSDAVAAARARVTETPDSPAAWTSLAMSLSASNRKAEAAEAAREVVRLDPNNWGAHVVFSELTDGYWIRDEGLTAAREAVRLAPDEATTHQNLGNAYLRRSQPKEARAAFQAALAIDPMNADAQHNLALTELSRSPAAAAVGLADTARMAPTHDLITHNLRVALGKLLVRTWYLLLAAGLLTFVTPGVQSQKVITDGVARLILGSIDLVVVVIVVAIFWRAARAGRLGAFARFAGSRDRSLVALAWVMIIGLAALISIAVLPKNGQILMFALVFLLFMTSRFIWFIRMLNQHAQSGAGQSSER